MNILYTHPLIWEQTHLFYTFGSWGFGSWENTHGLEVILVVLGDLQTNCGLLVYISMYIMTLQ